MRILGQSGQRYRGIENIGFCLLELAAAQNGTYVLPETIYGTVSKK